MNYRDYHCALTQNVLKLTLVGSAFVSLLATIAHCDRR